ncbi:hypothetical protein [Corallococcus llansteffanensis]|uniref:Uncharacterized protein n=1 Tax=Corallococcus llansteffanensis TaxID=2316731 RepID=A0A3A8MZJ4_9BACT|nr:hypothetical protein [Corallococcus llansteffanensis]RKH36740.1 hypothetical protein D7V93_42755 [Corallococcus llansteffanensis]
MSPTPCPDLEVLFAELEAGEGPGLDHAAECDACAALLEDHRLLEQDLFRLADPLPPPSLVANVMARVAESPVPQRREVWTGLAILLTSLGAGLGFLFTNDQALGRLGTAFASTVVDTRVVVEGLLSGAHALWSTAGVAVACFIAFVVLSSLLGLKRLVGSPPSLSEA